MVTVPLAVGVAPKAEVEVTAGAGLAKVASPLKNVVVLFGGVGIAPEAVAVPTGKPVFTAALIALPLPFNTPVIAVLSLV